MPIREGVLYGKFKKILISKEELQLESLALQTEILELQEIFHKKILTNCRFVSLVIVLFLSHRHPKTWLVSKNKKSRELFPDVFLDKKISAEYKIWKKVFFSEEFMLEKFFQNFRLTCVPGGIEDILLYWEKNPEKILLTTHVPTSEEMLWIQSQGQRYLTIDFFNMLRGGLVENERDALEFLLHDLAHADSFFKLENFPEGQIAFFQKLQSRLNKFQKYCQIDNQFSKDFHYCLSDMNSHPEHMRQYLRAKLIELRARKRANLLG